ncbi:MAG: adenylate/guanylate cyclase domain-containing protein, partial [Actinomycetota bacterium]
MSRKGTRQATLPRLPTGVVTFVFTDIEGSTRLLQRLGDAYVHLLDDHNRILRDAITEFGGVEVRPIGDAFFAVFSDAQGAVRAMVAAQLKLRSHNWPDEAGCRVRIGLHTGHATSTGDDYVGLAVHQASRISDAGHGGQILLSSTTADLVADM